MKGYFLNDELRRSTVTGLSLMVLFLLLTLLLQAKYQFELKRDYLQTMGVVAARIEEKRPELIPEIMPWIMREASEAERQKGAAFLREYGLSEELEQTLFPNLGTIFRRQSRTIWGIFAVMTFLLVSLNYSQYAFFYRRIRRITLGAKKLMEGEYELALREDREGDFSKLANSFNSMGKMIHNQMDALQKEKQFLVNLMSDISHQLKTPLSSLVVYNDIMLNKELSREQNETFLRKMQDQLERMKWLIYSILKLARLDARSIEFVREEQSLNETVHNAIAVLESKAAIADVTLLFRERGEIFFAHDHLWMEEALINIIKNGIEHTPEGGEITIDLEENPLYTRITVADTGEGIPPGELGQIFQRFYKVSTSRKRESLGIGLALARAIVEAHDGVIEAESHLGAGTRFLITFLK